MITGPSGGAIEFRDKVIPIRQSGALYELHLEPEKASVAVSGDLWHRRLGHRSYGDMRRLGELNVGVPKSLTYSGKCETCEVAKHTHSSFKRSVDHRASEPLLRAGAYWLMSYLWRRRL